ncbi:helix-turn-helix domain-containing protein [Plantactinospora endophytica]|uniref:Transcriptional regulator n=1 Tax=Plantactinospora endophytica TaxID=673535 RepID=A0ABQ4DU47_9ACTN|nr:helix-turn-helix transcriptional regulator [Plantactinospora endophytica]GIG85978.1 transcriptional regulator [Plantactinospora endophytica]
MRAEVDSTVPRRQLGRHLRQLREEARLTIKVVSATLRWSSPKIWRIESGATSMRSPDVEAMCRIYGATPEMTEALTGLAKETKARGWWHCYGDAIPEWFELYVGLEAAASHLRMYEPHFVPGLMQTEAYASEVFRIGSPELGPAERERAVRVRLGRQAILSRRHPPAPQLSVILDEAVLRRAPGASSIMREQLRQLAAVGQRSNVSVRILPFSVGLYRAERANGGFAILDFPKDGIGRRTEPPIVYSEGLTGALYLEKPHEVEAHVAVWRDIEEDSLTEAQSRDLIESIAEECPA